MKIIDRRGGEDARQHGEAVEENRELVQGAARAEEAKGCDPERSDWRSAGNLPGHADRSERTGDRGGGPDPGDTTNDSIPSRGAEAAQGVARPIVVGYKLGLQLICDGGQGGCGQEIFLASPQMIQGALGNGQFQGPCPSCHAPLVMRPEQTVITVPAQAMQQLNLNRHQRRAAGIKGNGR